MQPCLFYLRNLHHSFHIHTECPGGHNKRDRLAHDEALAPGLQAPVLCPYGSYFLSNVYKSWEYLLYWSNLSGVTSRNGCRLAQAALLTSRSTGPTPCRASSVAPQSVRSTHTGVMEAHCDRKWKADGLRLEGRQETSNIYDEFGSQNWISHSPPHKQ